MRRMTMDRAAAERFILSAARLVDRHRYALLFADGPQHLVVESLRGYRNADGGFGHALEPDLRCPGSQPAPTLYALEILREAGAIEGELADGARGWIAGIAEEDGGIPMVLPGFEPYPHSPWMAAAPGSFLTLALAAVLLGPEPPRDAWLARACEWSWSSIERSEQPGGYWLLYACRFLDAVPDEQRAAAALERLAGIVDSSAFKPPGGAEGEALGPLDISPHPGSRSRSLFDAHQIESHLDALEAGQQDDGGWTFDWLAWSPAQTNDWRGIVTLRALTALADHGRL